jgi:hypothetical protein
VNAIRPVAVSLLRTIVLIGLAFLLILVILPAALVAEAAAV